MKIEAKKEIADEGENEDRVEKKMKMKIEWKKTIQVESPRVVIPTLLPMHVYGSD